jgi:hypothetical protein
VHAELGPLGGDAELALMGLTATLHSNRFTFGLLGRASLPLAVGAGRVYGVLTAAFIGWRYDGERLTVGLELRSGQLLLQGTGFQVNRSDWLPWVEAAPQVGVKLGVFTIGVEVAAAPLRYGLSAQGEVAYAPFVRAGVWVAFSGRP